MRSFFATLRQLIIPAGARPGTPRTIIGPDVPAFLASYYAPFELISIQIYESDATTYIYQGQLDTGSNVAFVVGVVGLNLGVTPYACEMYRITPLPNFLGGIAVLDVGIKASTGGLPSHMFIDTGALIGLDGTLSASSSANIQISNGAAFTYAGVSIVETTPYTPTFSNVTLGTGGVILGRVHRIGDFVWGFVSLTLGVGGTLTGLPDFTLPYAVNTGVFSAQAPIGTGRVFDATGSRYMCQITASTATTGRFLYNTVSGANVVNANVGAGTPIAFAVNDQLFANFAYTVAS